MFIESIFCHYYKSMYFHYYKSIYFHYYQSMSFFFYYKYIYYNKSMYFIITNVPVWPWEVLELLPPPGHNHGNIESKNKRKWYVTCELFT